MSCTNESTTNRQATVFTFHVLEECVHHCEEQGQGQDRTLLDTSFHRERIGQDVVNSHTAVGPSVPVFYKSPASSIDSKVEQSL